LEFAFIAPYVFVVERKGRTVKQATECVRKVLRNRFIDASSSHSLRGRVKTTIMLLPRGASSSGA
jgi:hypothetical protein